MPLKGTCQAIWAAAMLSLIAVGCGKGGETGGNKQAAGPTAAELTERVKKALPARAHGVEWDARVMGSKDQVIGVFPSSWEESENMPGLFKPPRAADLGFITSYSVGSSCSGVCEARSAKAWAANTEKRFESLAGERFEVLSDEKDDSGRAMVAKTKNGNTTYIRVAKWKDGASRYYTCSATLAEKAAALEDAALAACRAGTATFLN